MILKTGKPKDLGLDDIQKEVKRLQGRASTLQSKAIVRTDVNVEKTGCAVTIIKNNTHNIERILVEELRPVINETHHLVRETRLRMGSHAKGNWLADFYAKAARVSDFYARADKLLDVAIVSTGIPRRPRLKRHVDPMGPLLLFGRPGECRGFKIGNLEEKSLGPMANITRKLASLTPKQWEKTDHAGIKTFFVFLEEMLKFLRAAGVRKACTPYRGTVAWEPTTRRIMMQLDWYSEGKSPIHFDDLTITDTCNSPRRGTRCRIFWH